MSVKRALVVHGSGLDEVAIHGETLIAELKDNKIDSYRTTPEELGVPRADLSELVGGSARDNAAITRQILSGKATTAQINAVAVNAGSAIYVAGITSTIAAGVARAQEIMTSGQALALVEQLAHVSQGSSSHE